MSLEPEVGQIRDELASLAERLADLGIRSLREAIEVGETRRPEIERRLTRARHALERAIGMLSDGAGD